MSFKKVSKPIRLQTRLIFYSTLIILFLMVVVIILVENRQSETIQEELQRRGMAIARNLAGVSTNALLTYNYIVLEQNAEKVALEEDIVYVIIHDKERRVAAYSGHSEKQGMILTDEVSQKALETRGPLIQLAFHKGKRILDISIPVYIKESKEKWGTIRIGLSLSRMVEQILKTRINLFIMGFFAIVAGILGSIFFVRRITRPISKLVETTISAAHGDLEHTIDIRTGDEIEELGKNFNHMIKELRIHRNQLEERLSEITSLKAYTDNILSSMTNGLITIDMEGRIVTVNEMAKRILIKDNQQLIGKSLSEALGLKHPIHNIMNLTLSQRKAISHSEIELEGKDGSLCLIASTALITDGRGETIGALMIFQDITELKDLEEKLRQADRLAALGTLSAGLAHEIKNPLSAIKTFVQLLPKKIESPSFMEKFNITVPREIERINQLVEDLLELTRTRKRPFVKIDVNHLISQVIELHGEEMKKRDIIFEGHLEKNIPSISGDSDGLYRAFSNLVINSIQAMPNGGVLSISSNFENKDSPTIKITFVDTGIGMDEETLKNLFNPFFTTKDKGVGLGMALTRKIVENHKGTIEAISKKDMGTTFILKLPVVIF